MNRWVLRAGLPAASRAAAAAALLVGVLSSAPASAGTTPSTTADPTDLYLVSLVAPGTVDRQGAERLTAAQNELLTQTQLSPVYRWTSAVNGFAVRADEAQVEALRADPRVRSVEANQILNLAARGGLTSGSTQLIPTRSRGGQGVVVGVVDTGLAANSPLFADTPAIRGRAASFGGGCLPGPKWQPERCGRKLVGATWFVAGFGSDRIRSSEVLSPADVTGHGTQVASVIAGNADVSVDQGVADRGTYGGVAPQARLAIYKACWSAPDPLDDGCASADIVTAIDRATRDGVDVLNLSVGGDQRDGTHESVLDQALLGATSAGVVTVAAAGNLEPGSDQAAAHPVPWVTTVGALDGPDNSAKVTLNSVHGTLELVGAGRLVRATPQLPIKLAVQAGVPGAARTDVRRCLPGTLNPSRTKDHLIVCERGGGSRLAKSQAVKQAGGSAMILTNTGPRSVDADLHAVPTVHLSAKSAAALTRFLAKGASTGVLSRNPASQGSDRVAKWSARGNPLGPWVKPDLVAPGSGVLGAIPDTAGRRWEVFTGTSAAAAQVSGVAARLRAKHPRWSASAIRSALSLAATGASGGALTQGAGRLATNDRVGLVMNETPRRYRAFARGVLPARELNSPSVFATRPGVYTRQVTNVSGRAQYWSAQVTGLPKAQIRVTPAAMTIAPGATKKFTVTVRYPANRLDSGVLTWRSGRGHTARIPIVLSR